MRLKVEYKADETDEGAITWNPANFHIWLNGMELDLVNSLSLVLNTVAGEPQAVLTFMPNEIDIDADTIMALQALLENAEELDEPYDQEDEDNATGGIQQGEPEGEERDDEALRSEEG